MVAVEASKQAHEVAACPQRSEECSEHDSEDRDELVKGVTKSDFDGGLCMLLVVWY